MSDLPVFGAGIWHFATYMDRYATEGYGSRSGLIEQIDKAGAVGDLSVVDLNWPFAGLRRHPGRRQGRAGAQRAPGGRDHAGDLQPRLRQGLDHQPRPGRTRPGLEAAERGHRAGQGAGLRLRQAVVRPGRLGLSVPGRTITTSGSWRSTGCASCVAPHPEIKFVIEYKPREPRNKIIFPNAARTLLAIQQVGLDNSGILLDFGHSLYGLETPADAAQLCIDAGRAVRDRRQRQLPRLGRRHGGRLGAPGGDVRVLPHAAQEQLGRRLAA